MFLNYFLSKIRKKYRSYKDHGGSFGSFILGSFLSLKENGIFGVAERFVAVYRSSDYCFWLEAQRKRLLKLGEPENIYGFLSFANNNEPLELLQGDWIVISSKDVVPVEFCDRIIEQATFQFKDSDVIYFDNDYLEEDGSRVMPYFKPQWDFELFLSTFYVSSFLLVSKVVVDDWLSDKEALDKDTVTAERFILWYLSNYTSPKISRYAEVAYSLPFSMKDEFSRLDLLKEFISSNQDFSFQVLKNNTLKLLYPMAEGINPKVSIIVPTRDMVDVTARCIESILKRTNYDNYNIYIIDNQSVDQRTFDYFAEIEAEPRIEVHRYDDEFNFSAINNFGVSLSDGEYVCLVNNDVEVISSSWLEDMLCYATRLEVGCVGPMLLYADETIQHAGIVCGLGNVAGHPFRYFRSDEMGYFGQLQVSREVSAVTAACLLVEKELFQNVGGLNAVDLKVAYNDVDFCLKVRSAGYSNIYMPHAKLYHHESLSRGSDRASKEKRVRYKKERDYMWGAWPVVLANDPFYNPHLSRIKEDYSFRLID